ncbi:MAG: hypothetical protein ACLF0G_03010 [Candidatus Brocadiia bacterium]
MITFQCSCGKRLKARDSAAGKRVRCPACRQPVDVPQAQDQGIRLAPQPQEKPEPGPAASPEPQDQEAQGAEEKLCPKCHVRLPRDAVLCTTCGFDFRTGEMYQPQRSLAERIPWATLKKLVANALLLGILVGAGVWTIGYLKRRQQAQDAPKPGKEAQGEKDEEPDRPAKAPRRRRTSQPLPVVQVDVDAKLPTPPLEGLRLRYADATYSAQEACRLLRQKIRREAVDAFRLSGHTVQAAGQEAPADQRLRLYLDVALRLGWDYRKENGSLTLRGPTVARCQAALHREGKRPLWSSRAPYEAESPGPPPSDREREALARREVVETEADFERYTDRLAAAVARKVFHPQRLPEAGKIRTEIARDIRREEEAKAWLAALDAGDATQARRHIGEGNPYLLHGLVARIDKIEDPALLMTIADLTGEPDIAARATEMYLAQKGTAPKLSRRTARLIEARKVLVRSLAAKFAKPQAELADDLGFVESAEQVAPYLVLAFARTGARVAADPQAQHRFDELAKRIQTRQPRGDYKDIEALEAVIQAHPASLLAREAARAALDSQISLCEQTTVLYLNHVAAGLVPDLEPPWPDGGLRLSDFQMDLLQGVARRNQPLATACALGLLMRVGGPQRDEVRRFVKLDKQGANRVLRLAPIFEDGSPAEVSQLVTHKIPKGPRNYPILDVAVDTYYRYCKEGVEPRHRAILLYFLLLSAKDADPFRYRLFALLQPQREVEERRAAAEALRMAGTANMYFLDDLRAALERATDAKVKAALKGAIAEGKRGIELHSR